MGEWDFPGRPVVKKDSTLPLQGVAGSIPGQGTRITHAVQRGQKVKKKKSIWEDVALVICKYYAIL